MKPSIVRKIQIAIAVLLMLLFLVANLYSVRRIMHYGVELYLYDKLNVAYQIGGISGLKLELEKIISEDKMPREKFEAEAFKKRLGSINEPGKYLQDLVADRKAKVNMFRNIRNLAFYAILIIILLRLTFNRLIKTNN